MTTIAFDGRHVASDTMGNRGSYTRSHAPLRKLHVTPCGSVFAVAGLYVNMLHKTVAWGLSGLDPSYAPVHGLSDVRDLGNAYRIDAVSGRWFGFSHMMPYWDEESAPVAVGSGGDFALGALRCGKNAMEAIRIAAIDDIFTNDVVDFVDLQNLKLGVQRYEAQP